MAKAITVADYIAGAIDISGKTQKQIAQEAGYSKPNVLSMMRSGVTKVPIDRIPVIARACGVDEQHLLRLALNEYMPETWEIIKTSLNTELLSKDELRLVKEFRKIKDELPPRAISDDKVDLGEILRLVTKSSD